jgi:uncharacterized heparinase superfamily protein
MRPTSQRCAVDDRVDGAPKTRHTPPGLIPEILRVWLRRALAPLLIAFRRNWFYRRLLQGKMPDRILFHPYDALPRMLEDADALLRGRFRFAGETVDVTDGSIFDQPPPSELWARALHGFAWLPPLAMAGGEPARLLATNLIAQWMKRNARYSEPAWLPEVTARRLSHLFAHGRFVIIGSDLMWRSKLFVSTREQARMLARIAHTAPEGLPRFEAAAICALSGACLDDSANRLNTGLELLQKQIAEQVLPDGGYVSRSPEGLVHAYRFLVMVVDAMTATGHEIPDSVRSAHDRMAPMLRFFRHGDGALALFNGGRECDARMVAGLLARDEVRGQPFAFAPHSGYQRMAAARAVLMLDCGTVPKPAFSERAHAGCLSFEFSSSGQRLIVNCGAAVRENASWDNALRATAAHSTVTVADTSMAWILPPGAARRALGARMMEGPVQIETNRTETTQGARVIASHDGYAKDFGIIHERSLTLSPNGMVLMGSDRLIPKAARGQTLPFAVRFHVHPDVRVSPSQSGGILLKLPSGEGWRFRAEGGTVQIEESIYLGTTTVRRTEQLVVTGQVRDQTTEIAWAFEQIHGAG